jgi:hypothetical protein
LAGGFAVPRNQWWSGSPFTYGRMSILFGASMTCVSY